MTKTIDFWPIFVLTPNNLESKIFSKIRLKLIPFLIIEQCPMIENDSNWGGFGTLKGDHHQHRTNQSRKNDSHMPKHCVIYHHYLTIVLSGIPPILELFNITSTDSKGNGKKIRKGLEYLRGGRATKIFCVFGGLKDLCQRRQNREGYMFFL